MLAEGVWLHSERRRLVRLCTVITGDGDAAEDLAQETLLEAWRNRHKLVDETGAEWWLNAIARNVCLRWNRRSGRDPIPLAAADELVSEPDGDELEGALDAALALLPPATRDVLVRHYVDGSPHAEIAACLGVSPGAVSMRISRGRVVLARLLAPEPPDGWGDTRVWCTSCGSAKLQMLRTVDCVAFRCAKCAPVTSAAYDLGNPAFARLLDELVRPAAILRRAAAWSSGYFGGGAHETDCIRCSQPARLRHERSESRRGLLAECGACGHAVWSSVRGLAQGLPESRAFAFEHGRVRTLPERDVGYRDTDATLVRMEAVRGSASLDVLFARDTLRVLAAH